MSSSGGGGPLRITSTGQGLFVKSTADEPGEGHALTAYLASTSGADNVAANVVSDNPENSAMYLSGREKNRGTLKIAHLGHADGSDANAAAVSVDLKTAGTACQGIFVTATDGPTAGDLLKLRNNGREDLVVKSTGRVGVGIPTGGTPAGVVEVNQPDDTTPGIVVVGRLSGADLVQFRNSTGAVRARVDRSGNIVAVGPIFGSGGVQLGATSTGFGGGAGGMLGLTNAGTVPTSNPAGGGVLYAEGGALKWRGSAGTVTTLAPA